MLDEIVFRPVSFDLLRLEQLYQKSVLLFQAFDLGLRCGVRELFHFEEGFTFGCNTVLCFLQQRLCDRTQRFESSFHCRDTCAVASFGGLTSSFGVLFQLFCPSREACRDTLLSLFDRSLYTSQRLV